MRKPDFALAKTKAQISFAVTAKLISAFVFASRIVQFLFYLNPKFQASSSFLCLYRSFCVRPGRKPRRPVFSRRGSLHGDNIPMQQSALIVESLLKQLYFYVCRKQIVDTRGGGSNVYPHIGLE